MKIKNGIEVHEFDRIICNEDYKEYDKYEYVDKKIFDEIIRFIEEYTPNEEDADIHEFMRISHQKNIGKVITIRNYVGLIQLKSGFKIQILPKIYIKKGEEDVTKKVFFNMLRTMQNFKSKFFNNASLNVDKMNLYEIFIYLYINELDALIRNGLKSSYIVEEDNLNTIKGKLMLNKNIQTNYIHKERTYCMYDEYKLNRPENKIIKSTLLKLLKISSNNENIKRINQILVYFSLVEPSNNYDYDFSKIQINRSTKVYETIISWSKIFLQDKSFITFSGKENSKALLFQMDKLFESYTAKMLKKVSQDDEIASKWKFTTQGRSKYLFNFPENKFLIKPDIIIEKEDKSKVILDTKWKALINNESQKFKISQADMYQMYVYAKKYNTSNIYLLYPLNDEMRKYQEENRTIEYKSTEENINITVYFVNLANMKDSMKKLIDKLK